MDITHKRRRQMIIFNRFTAAESKALGVVINNVIKRENETRSVSQWMKGRCGRKQ